MIAQLLYNLGLGLDQFTNVLLLGDPDESLSGRLGRAKLSGRPKYWVEPMAKVNDKIWKFVTGEENHCVNSVEPEERPFEKELWSWIKEKPKC